MKLALFSLIGLVSLLAQAAAPFAPTFYDVKAGEVENNYKYYTSRGMGPRALNFYLSSGFIRSAGAFDADAVSDVRLHFGIDQREFDRRYRINKRDGYRPKELSVVAQPQYAAVAYYVTWEKNTSNTPWAVWINMTSSEFDQEWNDLVKTKGYRLSRHVAYPTSDGTRHAAIFVKDGQGFYFYRGMTREQFRQHAGELAAQGFYPSDISVLEVGAGTSFSAIWTRQASSPVVKIDMSNGTYRSTFENYRLNGYKLRKVVAYNLGRSFAAIWEK